MTGRHHVAGRGEHQRVVVHRIELDLELPADVLERVERCAHHLRNAPQAVGILHPPAVLVRRDERAVFGVGDQPPRGLAGRRDRAAAPGRRARAGRKDPSSTSVESAAAATAISHTRQASASASAASAVESCVPLIERETLLRLERRSAGGPRRAAPARPACAGRRATPRPRRPARAPGGRAARGRPTRRPSPASGTTGVTSRSSRNSRPSTISGRQPE